MQSFGGPRSERPTGNHPGVNSGSARQQGGPSPEQPCRPGISFRYGHICPAAHYPRKKRARRNLTTGQTTGPFSRHGRKTSKKSTFVRGKRPQAASLKRRQNEPGKSHGIQRLLNKQYQKGFFALRVFSVLSSKPFLPQSATEPLAPIVAVGGVWRWDRSGAVRRRSTAMSARTGSDAPAGATTDGWCAWTGG